MPVNYCCKICDFDSDKKSNFKIHLLTKKHLKNHKNETVFSSNETQKNAAVLHHVCRKCKCNFNSRTTLWRHKKICKILVENIVQKPRTNILFCCEKCHLTFDTKLNLIRHKKKCKKSNMNEIDQTDENKLTSIIKENFKIIKEDEKLTSTEKLLALLPKLTDAMIKIAEKPANVNTNCNNKMTINMYLNEECKDAMNLTDFVNKVQVSLDDLMYTQQHGYVKGISNIFLKNLTDMDPKERPIHCSDKKRMQFYVKEEDKWEKDNQHTKIDNSIAKITHKQISKIREWEDKHPNFLEDDKLTHIWQKMCSETMGGVQDAERNKNCINIKKEVSNVVEVKEAMKD